MSFFLWVDKLVQKNFFLNVWNESESEYTGRSLQTVKYLLHTFHFSQAFSRNDGSCWNILFDIDNISWIMLADNVGGNHIIQYILLYRRYRLYRREDSIFISYHSPGDPNGFVMPYYPQQRKRKTLYITPIYFFFLIYLFLQSEQNKSSINPLDFI